MARCNLHQGNSTAGCILLVLLYFSAFFKVVLLFLDLANSQTNQETILEEAKHVEKEYTPYDGWYNNRAHPEWGVVGR